MFEWELVLQSAGTGHKESVMDWSTDYPLSAAELTGICNQHGAGGDTVGIVSVAFPGNGYVLEVLHVTGSLNALGQLGHPLPGHELVR